MKAKELAKFLEKCDPEADLIMTINGHYYLTLGAVVQGYRNLQNNNVTSCVQPGHDEYALYFFGSDIHFIDKEISPTDICLIDPNLIKSNENEIK